MGRREQQIEHLLRRAGFGGSPNEIDFYSEIGVRGTIDLLIYFDQIPDDVDGRIGQPGFVSVTTRGTFAPHLNITDARQRWLFRMVHSRAPAPGEDGALLAQPLRHRLHQDRRRLRRHRGDADAGGQAVRGSRRHQGAARAVPRARPRQLPRPADRRVEGSGDAGVAGRPRQHRHAPAGELRARDHGAVHVRRRQRRRGRRQGGGARVHRLEPDRGSARAAPTTTATSSAPTGTTTRSRTSPSRSTRTAAAPSPPTASRKAST